MDVLQQRNKHVPVHTRKAYRGNETQLHSFLNSALDGGEWSTSRPGLFTPRNEPRYLFGSGDGLDGLLERKISEPSRDSKSRIVHIAARSLYPLRYHGPGLGCHINPKIPNSIQEEIKSRWKSGKACCHSVQNLLSPSLLSKNLKIKIYRIIILPDLLYGCETWSLTLREERMLRV